MTDEFDAPPDPHYHPPVQSEGGAAKSARYGCSCLSVIMMITPIPMLLEASSGRRIATEYPNPVTTWAMAAGATVFAVVGCTIATFVYKRIFAKHFNPKVLIISLLITVACSAITAVAKLMEPDHDKAREQYEQDFDNTLKERFDYERGRGR